MAFYPQKEEFFLEDFDPEINDAIIFDEFDIDDYPKGPLRRLLNRDATVVSRKHTTSIILKVIVPIILIANIDTTIHDAPFNRRVKKIDLSQ